MTENGISIFLADDHAMVREGFAALVGRSEGMRIIGQCGDGLKVVQKVRACQPDVVLLDISMPGMNGLDICRDLTKRSPCPAVLILTMHDDEQLVVRAFENGASGYLVKEAAGAQLTEAICAVARGEVYLGPGIARGVLHRVSGRGADPHDTLTSRERQVLQLIAEGKTNRQVAEMLDVAVKTVDTHRTRLMHKLNIHDQTSLVKYALRRGIVSLE